VKRNDVQKIQICIRILVGLILAFISIWMILPRADKPMKYPPKDPYEVSGVVSAEPGGCEAGFEKHGDLCAQITGNATSRRDEEEDEAARQGKKAAGVP